MDQPAPRSTPTWRRCQHEAMTQAVNLLAQTERGELGTVEVVGAVIGVLLLFAALRAMFGRKR